jgi:hypothetical protein
VRWLLRDFLRMNQAGSSGSYAYSQEFQKISALHSFLILEYV